MEYLNHQTGKGTGRDISLLITRANYVEVHRKWPHVRLVPSKSSHSDTFKSILRPYQLVEL